MPQPVFLLEMLTSFDFNDGYTRKRLNRAIYFVELNSQAKALELYQKRKVSEVLRTNAATPLRGGQSSRAYLTVWRITAHATASLDTWNVLSAFHLNAPEAKLDWDHVVSIHRTGETTRPTAGGALCIWETLLVRT